MAQKSKLQRLKDFVKQIKQQIDEEAASLKEQWETKDDSDKKGLDAIIEHKKRLNVDAPYVVIDKEKHTMKRMQKDKVLSEWPIATGRRTKEDGWSYWNLPHGNKDFYESIPPTTPSMVAVIPRRSFTNRYSEVFPDNVIRFADAYDPSKKIIPIAVHPIKKDRIKNFDKEKAVTTGCINCPPGKAKEIADTIEDLDTIYVLPDNPLNLLGEYKGRLGINYMYAPDTLHVTSRKTGKEYVSLMHYASEQPETPKKNIFKQIRRFFYPDGF